LRAGDVQVTVPFSLEPFKRIEGKVVARYGIGYLRSAGLYPATVGRDNRTGREHNATDDTEVLLFAFVGREIFVVAIFVGHTH
jgi:hypothetical protein